MSQELTDHGLRNRNLIEVAGDSSAQKPSKIVCQSSGSFSPKLQGLQLFVMPDLRSVAAENGFGANEFESWPFGGSQGFFLSKFAWIFWRHKSRIHGFIMNELWDIKAVCRFERSIGTHLFVPTKKKPLGFPILQNLLVKKKIAKPKNLIASVFFRWDDTFPLQTHDIFTFFASGLYLQLSTISDFSDFSDFSNLPNFHGRRRLFFGSVEKWWIK